MKLTELFSALQNFYTADKVLMDSQCSGFGIVSLSTVDGTGIPHVSLISIAELFPVSSGIFICCVYQDGQAAKNLSAHQYGAISFFHTGQHILLKFKAIARVDRCIGDIDLSFFEARVFEGKAGLINYADIQTIATFTITSPESTFNRWRRQWQEMEALGYKYHKL